MALAVQAVTEPVEVNGGPRQGEWTYQAYRQRPDDGNRYEIIDGVLYVAAAPSPRHQVRLQSLVFALTGLIREHKLGHLFIAPIDLVMPGCTPVQPDALFLKNENPAHINWDREIEGIPDLIIEVASPSTAGFDRREKQDAYARAGVPEYWIGDPAALSIEVLVLETDKPRYRSRGVFRDQDRLPTPALPALQASVAALLS